MFYTFVLYRPCIFPSASPGYCWQNGTRCRDGVKVSVWCHPHLVWIAFEGSIPTYICFRSENFFVTLNCATSEANCTEPTMTIANAHRKQLCLHNSYTHATRISVCMYNRPTHEISGVLLSSYSTMTGY